MAVYRCRYKLKCKVVFLGSILVFALTVSYIHSTLYGVVSEDGASSQKGSYSRMFLSNDVQKMIYNSETCKIPRLQLYSSSIEHVIKPMKKPLICNGTNLFYFQDNVLSMNKSVLYPKHNTLEMFEFKTRKIEADDRPTIKACEVRGIERVMDSFYTYTESIIKENEPFNMLLKHDFVRVKCILNSTFNLIQEHNDDDDDNDDEKPSATDSFYNSEDHVEYEHNIFEESVVDFDQFLVQVYPRDEVFKRTSSIKQTSDQMNVMMIVLDSMSHMSFRRTLPKTYSYLKRNLASTVLNGYNIVGDATLAALIPILTGNFTKFSNTLVCNIHVIQFFPIVLVFKLQKSFLYHDFLGDAN